MTAIEAKTSSVNVIHLAMYTILAEKIVKVLGAMISLHDMTQCYGGGRGMKN